MDRRPRHLCPHTQAPDPGGAPLVISQSSTFISIPSIHCGFFKDNYSQY